MSTSFRILPEYGMVYVREEGQAAVESTMRAFLAYISHSDFRPGQKLLIDLSGVTGLKQEFARLMAFQAAKADVLLGNGVETLAVYLAPHPTAVRMARTILHSWEGVDSVVPMVVDNEADALALLGVPERSIAELLENVV